jgi:2-(1,2-epoxy-1,2-dihydrophenyl)acetyl-CoA isomerase
MAERSYAEVVASAHAEERELVAVERHGDRAVVYLADPEKRNVLSAPLMVQLLAHAEELAHDETVRAIVLTGRGRALTGGDLRMMRDAVERFADPADTEGATLPWQWIRYQFGAMVRLIGRTDKAFIAALNGPAAGVGLAFALTCDLAVAAQEAVIVPAFGRLGLVPELGTSWALTRALGYRRAFAYYVSGEHIDARRARPWARQRGRPRRRAHGCGHALVRPGLRTPAACPADRQAAASRPVGSPRASRAWRRRHRARRARGPGLDLELTHATALCCHSV